MGKVRVYLTAILVIFALSFSGCGSDNSETTTENENVVSGTDVIDNTGGDTTDNTISINEAETITLSFKNTSSTTLTKNNQVVTIDVQAFDGDNAPYNDGSIKIVYPNKAITGTDVGEFDVSEKALENGKATFTYTAPDDLQARVDDGDTSTLFGFYHTSDKNNTMQVYTLSYAPVANQVTLTDYELKSSLSTGTPVLGLESTMQLSFYVQDTDGNKISSSSINSIDVNLTNPAIGTIKDTAGNSGSLLNFTDENDVSVSLESNTTSGIAPIKVTANFDDANGDTQTLSSTVTVIILSGPPTAMSLSYISTENIDDRSKFIETWALSVTDKYNNPVNTNPTVSMGMIAGYATSNIANANPLNYLYYEPSTLAGTIVENGASDQLTTTAGVFSNVDFDNDVLVTFGEGYKFDASGKWDIEALNASSLTLKDNFEGSTTNNLAFAVGHNFRDEICRFGKKALGIVYPKDNIYTIDSTGTMQIQVEYDYYLTGKNVVLWANLLGNQNSNTDGSETVRLGHAQQENLRGLGLTDDTYSFAAGFTGVVRFLLTIKDTEEYFRNANFGGYSVTVTGDGNTFTVPGTSMNNGVTSCQDNNGNNTNGVAYIDVNITASPKSGTITISDILVSDEF